MATPQSPETLFEFARSNFGIVQLPDELLRFHAFLRERAPRAICEIGTASGGHFYMLSRSFASLSRLIGVDIHVRNRSFLQLLARDNLDVHLISGDSASAGVVRAVERAVAGEGLDVLFIDGDHTYAGVRNDYLNYRRLVRAGGVVAFHDIIPAKTAELGQETGKWTGDVPEFWRRVRAEAQTVEFVGGRDQEGYGIGVLIHSATAPLPSAL